jgi:hypothetical protein
METDHRLANKNNEATLRQDLLIKSISITSFGLWKQSPRFVKSSDELMINHSRPIENPWWRFI